MRIEIPHDFEPRPYQLRPMLHMTRNGSDGRRKRAVWVVHRRGGKDLTWLHIMCMLMLRRVGMYWHTFPTFEQGRKAIWEGFRSDGKRIIDNVFPAELVRRRDNQQMTIELKNGSIYRMIGTDKIETVGAGPVGVLHSEYSIAKPKARDLIAPMLRENEGWEACIYTPRGNNHGKKLFDLARKAAEQDPERWFCELQTLYDTRAYDPDQTIAEERAAGRPEALIRQEYLCDWTAANVGAVFGDLIEGLEKRGGVCDFEHPNDGVFTSWDMGISDAMAIWFWRVNEGRAPDLIDHYEAPGKPLSHFFDEVEARPYRYVKHLVPHDARARTYQTGVSTVEMFAQRFGVERVSVTPELSLADGIQAGRWLLQQPMRIHSRCAEGLEALRAYHYAWDEDRKIFSSKPEHDWSSHTADAFRYVACAAKRGEMLTRPPKNEPKPKYVVPVEPTLDELWEMQPKPSGRV